LPCAPNAAFGTIPEGPQIGARRTNHCSGFNQRWLKPIHLPGLNSWAS